MKLPQHILDLNADVLGNVTSVQVQANLGGYRSKLEKKAAETWVPGFFDWWLYEPFTLKFPGGSYVPDFFGPMYNPMQDSNYQGQLVVVEVKGWNQNMRADRLKFRVAAEYHKDWLQFCWLTWKNRAWHEDWYKSG